MDDVQTALEMTLVGMGLVFGAIMVLWAMMGALMRLTAEQAEVEAQVSAQEQDRKRRAAIAAVAVALAREQHSLEPHEFPLPPTAIVSAWQAVQRGRLLSEKGSQRR